MRLPHLVIISFSVLSCCHANVMGGMPFAGCEKHAYPPDKSAAVPQYTINLDLPPELRWSQVINENKQNLIGLIDDVKNLTLSIFGPRAFNFLIRNLDKLSATLPSPYREEMAGISAASGLLVPEVTMYNIFYEVFTFCTSIIIQDPEGKLYHGRNLDFGLFMGWDSEKKQWRVTQLLKPLVVHLNWQKGGKTLYSSINYLGYVGILTAIKKDHFTFSLDERFGLNGGFIGLMEWLLFKNYKQKWVAFLTREVMEEATSYREARDKLSHTKLLAPVYFILGGTKPGEGCIITRYRNNFFREDIGKAVGQESWFLVKTNYDSWKSPPFYDNRRAPAMHCLREGGQRNASFSLLYNVLSTKPVLNKLTTYTSLMDVKSGSLGTWLRDCEDPCWPW